MKECKQNGKKIRLQGDSIAESSTNVNSLYAVTYMEGQKTKGKLERSCV